MSARLTARVNSSQWLPPRCRCHTPPFSPLCPSVSHASPRPTQAAPAAAPHKGEPRLLCVTQLVDSKAETAAPEFDPALKPISNFVEFGNMDKEIAKAGLLSASTTASAMDEMD
mmetsp:Transcript_56146/g.149189  ORF Transcript_56146/g.149189 Transcript_56146/m.149189 type:complete len:114 (+) Transcript_56146:595-936(+)